MSNALTNNLTATDNSRGLTPNELAKLLRVSPDRVRAWIRSGELSAINTATNKAGRPRFVILPQHLEEFTRRRQVTTPPKTTPRPRRKVGGRDFFPEFK